MDPVERAIQLQVDSRRCLVELVDTELNLGMTFCQRLLNTSDPETQRRNLENARRALGTAKHFARKLKKGDGPIVAKIRAKLNDMDDLLWKLDPGAKPSE